MFVSPAFALADPDAVREIEREGHQIAVVGVSQTSSVSGLGPEQQRSALERSIQSVRAAVRHPEQVLDWKPQDFQWNTDTLEQLQRLGMRSISDVFPCNDKFRCQCPYALSVGKVTFPYPMQTGFWTMPISDIQDGSQTVVLDDRRVFALSRYPQDYLWYLLQKYAEQQRSNDPLIVAIHGSIVGGDDAKLRAFGQFLDHIAGTDGKLVSLANFLVQSYMTNFDVRGPTVPVQAPTQVTLTVSYQATLYCPKYRFRAYGRYEGQDWQLVASSCQFVSTGAHTLNLQVNIPKPPPSPNAPAGQVVYTVRVVGQASRGSCDNSDPDWPTLDKYEVMKEVPINVLPRCIPLEGRTQGDASRRLDVVFVPDTDYGSAQSVDSWLPTLRGHINAQIDQRLGGKSPVTDNLDKFNFYYTRDQGNASEGSTGPRSSLPTDLEKDCAFADAFVVFHNEEINDSSSVGRRPNIYSAEGPIGRSFIHESGHGLFGLADEYSGSTTTYFQPNPHANIWATRDGCRADAANAGWNPDDCSKFTDFQGDWWKLGNTSYIMADGTHFANGWGVPASRRINWRLSNISTVANASARPLAEPLSNNTTHLNLTLSDSGFSVNRTARVKDAPPNQLDDGTDYVARLLSSADQVLGEFAFGNPRYIYGEPGYTGPTYLSSATFALNLPYYHNASTVKIFNSAGALLSTISIASLASGGVSGTVIGSGGQTVAGARVELIGPDLATVATASNGQYLLQGLSPGSYVVNVIPPPTSNLIPQVLSVSVAAGQTSTRNASLQLGTTVQGRVFSVYGRAVPNAILYMSGYETPRYATDSNGYYGMRGLTPGSYTLNVDSTRSYVIYVNDQYVGRGTSVDLSGTAGQSITVNFVEPGFVYLPFIGQSVGQASFAWLDTTNGGTIVAQGDDTYQYVALPFAFNFYGNTYSGLYVSSNGFVSFGSGYSTLSNSCIASTSSPNNAIYALWDDLLPSGGGNGNVYVKQIDSGTFVIEWYSVKRFGSSDYETFEIVLRSDHSITLQYLRISNTGSSTVGVENASGTLAQQYLCNGAGTALTNLLAIRYMTQ
ncbi:MAG: carboxypeptidase regulatory-like domain-containing protein [Chloroflexi bacterium]|nr:carboxypeptidase regulatory-like domain-containing protein [Chloroflexota bacterium]